MKSTQLALTLGGGGARSAYQVGVLRAIARRHPNLQIPLLTGVSAGAINISHLANFEGNFADSVDVLTDLWMQLRLDNVFYTAGPSLIYRVMKVGMRLSVGLPRFFEPVHGMVDTQPLREYLCHVLDSPDGNLRGIDRNLANGRLKGVALAANCYATGETVVFFRGHEIDEWERPHRRSVETPLNVEHIMATSALPLLFSPVRIADRWYGDGGVRLHSPLGPAVHMGADQLLAISTHYLGTTVPPPPTDAPSPATVLAALYNAVFLDNLDQDVLHMERINQLLRPLAPEHRRGLREIDLLVIRPSQDIGAIAFDLKDRVPPTLRFLLKRLGSSQASSEDFLSTVLFHPDYVRRLVEIGERDGESHSAEIDAFLDRRSTANAQATDG